MFKHFLATLALAATLPLALAQSPAPANPTVRLRATIEKVDATSLTVKERSGEVITLVRPAAMDVSEVYPLALADIKPGSYIGTAAMPQADGTSWRWRCWCSPRPRAAPAKATTPGTCARTAP